MHPSFLALAQSGAELTMLQASGSADALRAGITGLGPQQSAEAPKFELMPESSPDSVLALPTDVTPPVGQLLPQGGKPLPPAEFDGGAMPGAAAAMADLAELLPQNPVPVTVPPVTTVTPTTTPVPTATAVATALRAATPVATVARTAMPTPTDDLHAGRSSAPEAKAQQDLPVVAAARPMTASQRAPSQRNKAISAAEGPGRNVRDTAPARENLLTTAMDQPKTIAAKSLPPIDPRPPRRPDARAALRVAGPERQTDKIPATLVAAASVRAVPVSRSAIGQEAPLAAAPSLIGLGQKPLLQNKDAALPGRKFDFKPVSDVRPADLRTVQRDVVTPVTTPPVRTLQTDTARQVIAEAIAPKVTVESPAAQPASTSVVPIVQATNDLLSIRSVVPAYSETAPSPVTSIATPVSDVAWAEALGDRVAFMANGNVRALEVRLNPAELGPLQVQIAVDKDQIEITFNVSNAVTREAIENSLPRLKDMLAQDGMSLAGASVDDHDSANRAADGGDKKAADIELHDEDGASENPDLSPEPATARGSTGLVDTYA